MAADGKPSLRRGIGARDGVTCTNVPLNVRLKCKRTREEKIKKRAGMWKQAHAHCMDACTRRKVREVECA